MTAIMLAHAVSLPSGAAKLHDIDWNDLRYVLALARGGSFATAGRALGTDATTVGRRLRILESRLGTPLFSRDARGAMSPTPTGEIAVAKAETIEAEVMALSGALDAADPMTLGKVRLTAAPSFINRLLIPAMPGLLARHTGLQLELIGDSRNLNLTRREADMALRLARPADAATARWSLNGSRRWTMPSTLPLGGKGRRRACRGLSMRRPWRICRTPAGLPHRQKYRVAPASLRSMTPKLYCRPRLRDWGVCFCQQFWPRMPAVFAGSIAATKPRQYARYGCSSTPSFASLFVSVQLPIG